MLDCADAMGTLEVVSADSYFWENCDVKVLVETVGQWNSQIALLVRRYKGQIGGDIVAPITDYPNFEHLEAETDEEKDRRLKSDFLCYANHDGLFADFHSLRHLFITNLGKAGVKPKMAQTLARHSDVRLTLGVYSHADRRDQVAAIESLAGSPGVTR